jgi:hypothetical protein
MLLGIIARGNQRSHLIGPQKLQDTESLKPGPQHPGNYTQNQVVPLNKNQGFGKNKAKDRLQAAEQNLSRSQRNSL